MNPRRSIISRQALGSTLAALIVGAASHAAAQDFGAAPGGTPQQSTPQSLFLFSAVGPGGGHGTIGMGGRVYLIIPTFDLNYVRGFNDNFDFILNLNTLGVITFADIGVRLRLVGDADSGFSLGLKAAATPILVFVSAGDGAAGGFGFGVTPGAVASFGSRSTQFTLGFDVPIFLGAAGFVTGNDNSATTSGSDVTPVLRPSATIEFGVGQTTNMYVQVSGYIAFEGGGGFFGPIVAVGAAW